jgi:hypothetical protein
MFELTKLNDKEVNEMLSMAPRRPGKASPEVEKLRSLLQTIKVGETHSYPKGEQLPKTETNKKDRYKNVLYMDSAVKYVNETYAEKKGTRFLNFRDTQGRYAVAHISAEEVKENTIEIVVKTSRTNLRAGDKIKKFDSDTWKEKRLNK